jgi:hypothetical protein
MLRLMIYQSQRNDWALAILGDGEPTVLGYRKTIEDAQTLASNTFKQPLCWRPRTGHRVFVSDHPSVSMGETTSMWVAFLHLAS